ncbi:septum formation protein Maf [Tepiditoga spiralis]|uniref:dTTP/UTP pyrophosphatase n=1 Tax=Tepiditoga spiralis TaxID=2108365 RepID=A0A7G1G764_9BACT|nr:septum formation protein Maf [Tepiditoga spiralis]
MNKYNIILGSGSPRRYELLKLLFNNFEVKVSNTVEKYSSKKPENIVVELSELKSNSIKISNDKLLITADTIVVLNEKIIGKPNNFEDAFHMLKSLSGKKHEVFTGVTIRTLNKKRCFYEKTEVFFNNLTDSIIKFYLSTYEPFDKAGSYGIQDFGAVFINKIIGDYYNVMGLPISRLFFELQSF